MIFYDDGEFWRPTRVGDGDSDERGVADGTGLMGDFIIIEHLIGPLSLLKTNAIFVIIISSMGSVNH